MNFRGIPFIKNNLSLGNRLSESFYGVVMVVIMTGLINSDLPPDQSTLRLLLGVSLAVNISWGIIDGVTSMYGGLVNRADFLRIANEFREDRKNPEKREMVSRSLQGTIVENLSDEEQSEVIDMIGTGKPVHGKKFPATAADWNVAFAIVLIDFVLIFPVVIPFFVIDNVRWAVVVSHAIALIFVSCVAVIWAKHLNLSTWKAAIIVAIISFIAIYSTYLLGW